MPRPPSLEMRARLIADAVGLGKVEERRARIEALALQHLREVAAGDMPAPNPYPQAEGRGFYDTPEADE